MTNLPTTSLPPGLAVLLDALDGMVISNDARASLAWLAGFEAHTVENIAEVIIRVRQTPVGEDAQLPTTGDLAERDP